MMTRTTRKTVTFKRPFTMSAIDKVQPSGTYTVDTDEELIDGLSFLAYRRVATLLHLPSTSSRVGVTEIVRSIGAGSSAEKRPTVGSGALPKSMTRFCAEQNPLAWARF